MKKRVNLAACYFQKNYGSMLQAYALQEAVSSLGYEAENLRIDGIAREIRNKKLGYYARQLADWSVVKEKAGMVRKVWQKKRNKTFACNSQIRNRKFQEFQQSFFKVSPYFASKKAMGEYVKDCQAVIVGSDQLWLPSNITADYYTLNFVPLEVRKAAYATSFGVSNLPKRMHEFVANFLNRIDYVSVREEKGRELVASIAHREVPVVCDPTMLFAKEEWAKLIAPQKIIQDKYIFCYFLGNNFWQREIACKLREKTGYKIVSLLHMDEYVAADEFFPDIAPYDVGPAEFVNLIRNAEYVLTDSFHGTVFSALHGKDFFTFRRFSQKATLSTNSRMDSLFSLLGVPERLLDEHVNVEDMLKMCLDVDRVLARIEKLRRPSWAYIKQAIGD
ncbi:polysaccharide pyruvyl transferase family protein [Selenomonas ruminantium]|uniref:Polysaccharide pyruvyl transferase n=1 Tax=Selenomonas ruminantium TaxID=971 RepID=A0A1H0NXP6_SELRU|nr:polysaccharide pyruvyl transferase family protein [Selenomonas ruminantium]SDO97441.1 Polysaccharide pyruvyl transferase [Selenomonas ruminantium]